MKKRNGSDGRGKNANSRANLLRGASRPNQKPDMLAEIAPGAPCPVESADQALPRVDPVETARQMLRDAAPDAAAVLARLVTGSLRCDPRTRQAAARTVLEVSALLPAQPQQSPGHAGNMADVAARFSKAVELHYRTVDAVPADVVKREDQEKSK